MNQKANKIGEKSPIIGWCLENECKSEEKCLKK